MAQGGAQIPHEISDYLVTIENDYRGKINMEKQKRDALQKRRDRLQEELIRLDEELREQDAKIREMVKRFAEVGQDDEHLSEIIENTLPIHTFDQHTISAFGQEVNPDHTRDWYTSFDKTRAEMAKRRLLRERMQTAGKENTVIMETE